MTYVKSETLITGGSDTLPIGAIEGMFGYAAVDGFPSYYDGSSWQTVGSVVGRVPHFDNHPPSPSSYDDEFESSSLDAKWTAGSGQTNAVVSTIDTLSDTRNYEIDTTWPSYLLWQGHAAATTAYTFSQSVSLASSCTIFFKVVGQNRTQTPLGANEGNVAIKLENSGDANEAIILRLASTGVTMRCDAIVNNNGATTTVSTGTIVAIYGAIYKSSNDYYFFVYNIDGGSSYVGKLTKTGVTTFDRLRIEFTTSDDTVTPIMGVDFVRYYPSITYALRNA